MKWRFLVVLLVGCAVQPVSRQPADDWNRIVVDPGFDAEFSERLRVSANEAYYRFQELRNVLKPDPYRRIVDRVIYRFSKSDGIRRLAFRYGRVLFAAWVIDNIVTAVIMPAVFLAIGQPALAAVSYFTPTHAITYVSTFYVAGILDRRRLERELGLKDIRELDKLKREIMGFSGDQHIASLLYQEASDGVSQELGLELVRNLKSKAQAGLVSVPELERIVLASGPEGQVYLDFLGRQRTDQAFYGAQLLRYCFQNEESSALLRARAAPRAPTPKSVLTEYSKLKAAAERAYIKWDSMRPGSVWEADLVREIINTRKRYLIELGREITRAEYVSLDRMRSGLLGGYSGAPAMLAKIQQDQEFFSSLSHLIQLSHEYTRDSWIEAVSRSEIDFAMKTRPGHGGACSKNLRLFMDPS